MDRRYDATAYVDWGWMMANGLSFCFSFIIRSYFARQPMKDVFSSLASTISLLFNLYEAIKSTHFLVVSLNVPYPLPMILSDKLTLPLGMEQSSPVGMRISHVKTRRARNLGTF